MLPKSYDRWFVEMCGRPAPVETRTDCSHCGMVAGSPDAPPEGPFDSDFRCCTYHPHLAPHFVGGILREGSEHGQRVVRERIAARVGVSPLGLMPLPDYAARYQRLASLPGAFGRARELKCPFNVNSSCGIWQHRGIVCAAFHCKYDRGAMSAGLWNLLVVAFNAIERALAQWLLARQGLEVAACDALLHNPADAALDARAWGKWRGREEAYFLEAAWLIESLSWSEVAAASGGALGGLAAALSGAVERLAQLAPPERVSRNEQVLIQLGAQGARLRHPGISLDPLEVPAEVGERLARFGSGRLAELGLDESLVRKLIDWQVLLPL